MILSTDITTVSIEDIVIADRFRQDLGDIDALAGSIEKFGLLQPIGIDEKNRLIFGLRRLSACKKLGWETIPARVFSIENIVGGEFEENELRKDFSVSERVAIAKAIEEQLRTRHGGDRRSDEFQGGNFSTLNQDGGKSRDLAAERSGFGSGRTYDAAKQAVEQGIPELVGAMDDGQVSIHAAARIAELEPEDQASVLEAIEAGEKPSEVLRSMEFESSDEWYTPAEIVTAAREVLGGIDTDPASCAIANETVRATCHFDQQQDGLQHRWHGRVWLNPPYSYPKVWQFCEALLSKYQAKEISEAIVLVNNSTETSWGQLLLTHCNAVCFPSSRLKFIRPEGKSGTPTQGQMIFYFGDRPEVFQAVFTTFGVVMLRDQGKQGNESYDIIRVAV